MTIDPNDHQKRTSAAVPIAIAVFVCFLIFLAIVGSQNSNDNSSQNETTQQNTTTQDDSSSTDTNSTPAIPLPTDLQDFDNVNSTAISNYNSAPNDIQRSEIRVARDKNVKAAVVGGIFKDWPATLKTLGTDGDGDAYVQIIPDGCPCRLETTNNSFSDALEDADGNSTLIKLGSPIFKKLRTMSEGQRVIISGRIIQEMSLTEAGSVNDPEWLTVFSDISDAPE